MGPAFSRACIQSFTKGDLSRHRPQQWLRFSIATLVFALASFAQKEHVPSRQGLSLEANQRRQAMSFSVSTLLTRNLQEVFGENDPARRRAAIDEIFTEDCVFYDPRPLIFLPEGGHRACRLRAVNAIKSAFYGLGCHLSPCMSLELRFFVDSIPSALTILFNTLRTQIRATDSRSGDLKFLVAHAHYFKCLEFRPGVLPGFFVARFGAQVQRRRSDSESF
jgi:hypothetical protein